MGGSGRHRHDLAPVGYVALAPFLAAHGHDSASRGDSNGVVAPRRHCHNAPPSTDITGARRLIPDRKDASVVGETDRMKIAGGDGGNVTPPVDRALPTTIIPHGNGGSHRL